MKGEYLQFEMNCSISPELRKVVADCFETHPDRRPQINQLVQTCNALNYSKSEKISTKRIKYFFMRLKYHEKIIDSRAANEPRRIFDIVNGVDDNFINSTIRSSGSVLSGKVNYFMLTNCYCYIVI